MSLGICVEIMQSVTQAQLNSAVGALFAYLNGEVKKSEDDSKKKKSALFDQEEDFHLVFTTRKVPEKKKHKPMMIPIPNSLYAREGASVCLITKDPQDKYAARLQSHPIENVCQVVSVSNLGTEFKGFKFRRELLANHDLFIADEAIIPMLPRLIGTKFFEKKKYVISSSFLSYLLIDISFESMI